MPGKNREKGLTKWSDEEWLLRRTVDLAVLLLLGIFPLYYRNFYSDIMNVKYQFCYCTIIVMAVILLAIKAFFLVQTSPTGERKKWKSVKAKDALKKMNATEWFIMIFLVIAIISTFASDYFYEAFWGNEGRYSGLFLWLLYGVLFFAVAKLYVFKTWHLDIFLISGFLVCMLGILDYFLLDPLGFKIDIVPNHRDIFTSTIGNVNSFSAFALLYGGLAAALFGMQEKRFSFLKNLLCMATGFVALYTSRSDNAFLGLAAIFVCLPFVLSRTRHRRFRYLIILAVFLTVGKGLQMINSQFPDRVIGMDSISGTIVGLPYLGVIVIALWVIIAVLYISGLTKAAMPEEKDKRAAKIWIGIWAVLIGAAVCGVLFAFYDINIRGNGEAYGKIGNYLLWNDDWGTHRGFIWRIAIENYKDFSPLHKLFGYGLDTFGILTKQNNGYEMLNKYGEIYDSAHNGYLQYLITVGPVGMLAYIGVLLSSLYLMVKKQRENPYVMGIACAMAGYMAQATVNIDLPIVMPIFLLLMSMGVAACRKEDRES